MAPAKAQTSMGSHVLRMMVPASSRHVCHAAAMQLGMLLCLISSSIIIQTEEGSTTKFMTHDSCGNGDIQAVGSLPSLGVTGYENGMVDERTEGITDTLAFIPHHQ